jgi:hypothetical protein
MVDHEVLPPWRPLWRDCSPRDLDVCLLGKSTVASYVACVDAFREHGFEPVTMLELSRAATDEKKLLAMRHDIDHSLVYARVMAEIEAREGVRSTYYMLPPGDYGAATNYYGTVTGDRVEHSAQLARLASEIAELGHEIGIHHDFVQLSHMTGRTVESLFAGEIEWFRGIGIEVLGVCSHGSRYARQHEFTNYEIFLDAPSHRQRGRKIVDGDWSFTLGSIDHAALGIEYEAYSVPTELYIADVGSAIGLTDKRTREYLRVDDGSAADFETLIGDERLSSADRIIALIHPEWWQLTTRARGAMRFERVSDKPAMSAALRVGVHNPVCQAGCNTMVERAPRLLSGLVNFDGGTEYRAAAVSLERLRAEPLTDAPVMDDDHVAGLFSTKLFAPDLAAIAQASNARRAQPLPDSEVKDVDGFGGAPIEPVPFAWPRCALHWSVNRGLFRRAAGRQQGNQVVDATLIAYLSLRRFGDFVHFVGYYLVDSAELDILLADTLREFATTDSLYIHGVSHLVLGPWPASEEAADALARRYNCEGMRLQADASTETLVELMGRPYA